MSGQGFMNFYTAAHTDVGIKKDTNQDSYCILQAETPKGNILMAVICDGMGGLESGEVASASIIRAFKMWFSKDLPYTLSSDTYFDDVKYEWDRIIKSQNQSIAEYGRQHHIQLGSTITAMIVFEDGKYLIGHVGDSRAYKIDNKELTILTTDQTVVANEVRLGKLTQEEAMRDPRRNVLLQCIGASRIVEPDYIGGLAESGVCYMLCSDGFRHEISETEIQNALSPIANTDEIHMKNSVTRLIELNKSRGETDNITALLIKTC